MLVNLSFVPPGGGEVDYELPMDMPALPSKGDYIVITRTGETGSEDFVVKRIWWLFEFSDKQEKGKTSKICVECEFARGHFSSESHKRACDRYDDGSGKLKEFDTSMY